MNSVKGYRKWPEFYANEFSPKWPPNYKGKIISVFYEVEVRVKHDSFIGGVEHVTKLPITVLPPVLVPVVKQ